MSDTCPIHGGKMLDVLWHPGEPETICIACLRDNKDRAVATIRQLRTALREISYGRWNYGNVRSVTVHKYAQSALAATAEWEA